MKLFHDRTVLNFRDRNPLQISGAAPRRDVERLPVDIAMLCDPVPYYITCKGAENDPTRNESIKMVSSSTVGFVFFDAPS